MEGDRVVVQDHTVPCTISIHSLRMEGDYLIFCCCNIHYISIHSLRMEGDQHLPTYTYKISHFNPLPPHGGRLWSPIAFFMSQHFNPLPPHGGRHCQFYRILDICIFQSTPSAWRETIIWQSYTNRRGYFNPLPPHGGRLTVQSRRGWHLSFQSTPSAWRETAVDSALSATSTFQSTPSAWRETDRRRTLL